MSEERFMCQTCGFGVAADEDGCCATCGDDCEVWTRAASPAVAALTAERDALVAGREAFKRATVELAIRTISAELVAEFCPAVGRERDMALAERDAALARLAAAEAVIAGVPTEEPERYEGDNHGDSFSSGWDCGEVSIANRLRAALAPRAEGEAPDAR